MPSATDPGIRTEERTKSGDQEIISRRDHLLAVRVIAARRRPPTWLAVWMMQTELERLGVSLSLLDADAITRRVLAAEEYPMYGAGR